MTRSARVFCAALVLTGIVYFQLPCSVTVSPTRSHTSNISPLSTFIFQVYLDKRGGSNQLRILAINRCHKGNQSLLSIKVNNTLHYLTPRPIEGNCPWRWAKGCELATYLHEREMERDETEVIIVGEMGIDSKKVLVVEDSSQKGITVCIPPLYWYTDWTKLIFFIEWWKTQYAKKFFFYFQSSSKEVKTVLDYYQKQEIVEVISWSLLPDSENFNANDKIYRLAHSLAENDCLLRATTDFVTSVDIDEIILPDNGNLEKYLFNYFTNETVGSLLFPHRILLFQPTLAPFPFAFSHVDYRGVVSPVFKKIQGPPKAIVRRNAVDRLSTHKVISFQKDFFVQLMVTDCLLLHSRYNYVGIETNHTKIPITIVENAEEFRRKLVETRDRIFPHGADFKEETQRILGACLADWRHSQHNCKAPATGCLEDMKGRENWVKSETSSYIAV